MTATYGVNSRQATLVHARCRRLFLLNPFLVLGWCVYKYYGPIFARWSRSSRFGFRMCKFLVADPIVNATGESRLRSALCLLYLFVLSLFGLLFLVPSIIARRALQSFTGPNPHRPPATDGAAARHGSRTRAEPE